ncbi:class I SAM-dependent methyltransferase [Yersinia kristensenii]|uniref:class I SAM-dependent methyltransferase n=1 Tax=Yersinia kristensenii TaxID=28152 RepID=UPI0011A4B5EE|nr:SAM-dependent methyltransferase [Yersinia kristensenii]MBW5813619.1 class I SAM-dependent methyltransferase [Yersinia kristensenii]MBW5816331.1 class I SAM-dependent methyltransferase [Yersinia kristensenii]MBW5828094.1 class I SAM-dependent methyltransferase [Yersinia kristensenii]MBW5840869.1 class I SAM-dependent methyltransferase [Yersinia kristensenii]MDA5487705.1 SAM-dependent methyltransferase [Yersinia kristensenii]
MTKNTMSDFSPSAELICILRAKSYGEKREGYKTDDYISLLISHSLTSFFSMTQKSFLMPGNILSPQIPAGSYEFLISRIKYIDEFFQLRASEFSNIFILGAGFDSRAIRFQNQLQQSRVYELDHPVSQRNKKEKLQELSIPTPQNLHYIPIDFNQQDLTDILQNLPVKKGEKNLFILEGLIMYLSSNTVDSIFSAIGTYAPTGSKIIFDYVYSDVLAGENTSYGSIEVFEGLKNIGEHWVFGIEKGSLPTFLNKYHIKLYDEADANILEQRFFTNKQGKSLGKLNKALAIAHGIK